MKDLIQYLIKYTKNKSKLFVLPFFIVGEAAVLVRLASLLIPIVNNLSTGKTEESLKSVVLYVLLVLLYIVFRLLRQTIIVSLSSENEKMVYDGAIHMISKMKQAEIYKMGKGMLISLLNNELRQNKKFILSYLYELIYQPVVFILMILFIFNTHPVLAFVMIPMMLIMVLISYICSKKLSVLYSEKNRDIEKQLTTQREIFANISTLKLYGCDEFFCKLNKDTCEKLYKDEKEYARRKAVNYLPSLINEYLPTIVVVVITMILMKSALLNYGQFVSVLQLLATVSLPFSKYADTIVETRNTCVTIRKIKSFFLTYKTENVEPLEKQENKFTGKYIVDISNLSFQYDNRQILKNCSLQIKKGEHIGIIGFSGAGKSTLLNIILGFLSDYNGSVKLFGCEVNQTNPEDIWKRISYVDQNRYMLNETIAFNISAGETSVSNEKIEQVVDMTNFRNDIENKLEDGLNTVLNEGGMNLSGGQREKLSIARALYKESELLILDEPSSALDGETDRYIVETLDRLKDSTIIIVSHRLSTLSKCERILSLREGSLFREEILEKVQAEFEV